MLVTNCNCVHVLSDLQEKYSKNFLRQIIRFFQFLRHLKHTQKPIRNRIFAENILQILDSEARFAANQLLLDSNSVLVRYKTISTIQITSVKIRTRLIPITCSRGMALGNIHSSGHKLHHWCPSSKPSLPVRSPFVNHETTSPLHRRHRVPWESFTQHTRKVCHYKHSDTDWAACTETRYSRTELAESNDL